MMRSILLALGLTGLLVPQTAPPQKPVPAPSEVVTRMLALAQVTKADVVFDLGSGDGEVPIAAAKTYGAKGVGLDIDPDRIALSWVNAKAAGVADRVEFREQDIFKADLSQATVVTVYLLARFNEQLRPLLTKQLRPGTRVVSHTFAMGPSWPPARTEQFKTVAGTETTIYLWKADGKIRP
jgi:cyclopropane fatty-acyl-phospholipid synthase-like methyltransferase